MNAYNLNNAALSFVWQAERDDADRIFRASENDKAQKVALIQQAIDNASALGKHYSQYESLVTMINGIFNNQGETSV